MISRRTERIGSILAGAIFVLLGVLIVLSAYQIQYRDADIFWALRSGEWIVNNHMVPLTDPFSYTFEGKEWVDFTWGFQVAAHLFYSMMGWGGLFILQLLITGLTFVLIYLNVSLLGSRRLWLSASLLFIVFAGSFTRLFIRPHLFSYLLISAYLLILNIHEKRSSALIYLLFPLQVLWVNVHSSAILGVFITGAYAAGGVIDLLRGKGRELGTGGAALKRLVAVSIVLPFFSLLNPYGLKLAVFPLIHQGGENTDALRHIGEWLRLPLKELLFYLWPQPVNFFAFKALLLFVLIAFVLNRRRLKSRDLILFAGAFYMAATHVRWVAQFAFFGVPLLAANLAGYMDLRTGRLGADRVLGGFKLVAAAISAVLVFFVVARFSGARAIEGYGIGVRSSSYPEGTVAFMKSERIRGNIYNEYVFGGYLILNYPEVKVFIDGRTPTVYSPYFFWTSRLVNDAVRWKRLVAEHSISIALIKLETPLCSMLHEDEGWTAVSFDDVSVLYLKRASGFREVISRWGFTELKVCADTPKYELPEEERRLKAMRDELKTALGRKRTASFARPHRILGLVDTALGEGFLDEAADELKKAVGLKDNAGINYDLGLALARLDRSSEAIEAFTRAVKKDKSFKDPQLALGLTHYEAEDWGRAIEWLDKYIDLADDKTEHAAYRVRGMSCFKLGRFDCAVSSLKRAAFTTDDAAELGDIYYNLGNALFEKGSFADGKRYYGLAMEAEPEYRDVLRALADSHGRSGKPEQARRIVELL